MSRVPDTPPMAILDLELTALAPELRVPARYPAALALCRWEGRPVAVITQETVAGALDREALISAVLADAGWRIEELRLRSWLSLPAAPPPLLTATVAVCTRDRPEDLQRCLRALARLPADGQEVLVVDSCSRGEETRHVVEAHPGVRYVRAARPGLDLARNLAIAEARGEVVAFTDDDAAPDPGWLRALLGGFAHPRVQCVTGLTLPLELETPAQVWFERTNGFARGLDRRVFDGALMNPFLAARAGAGVNMALRRGVVQLVGWFDEALDAGTPSRSGGDHEFFVRVLGAGYCIGYEPAALSWHRHRREWAELRAAIAGYGTGVYAFLMRHLLRGDLGAPRLALGWLRQQVPALAAALVGRPGSPPADLLLAELGGCLRGPGAYLRARREARAMPEAHSA